MTFLSTVLGLSRCLDGVCLGVCTERHDPIGGIIFHKTQKNTKQSKKNTFYSHGISLLVLSREFLLEFISEYIGPREFSKENIYVKLLKMKNLKTFEIPRELMWNHKEEWRWFLGSLCFVVWMSLVVVWRQWWRSFHATIFVSASVTPDQSQNDDAQSQKREKQKSTTELHNEGGPYDRSVTYNRTDWT